MKHLFRFHGQPTPDGSWVIEGDEHQHLTKVVRLGRGDAVEVMDGKGRVVRGVLASLDGRRASVAVETVVEQKERPRPAFHMGIGALKPQSIDDILPSLIELGVDAVDVFLQEGTAKFRGDDKYLRRWERIALNAAKQCKRTWLPTLHVWDSLEELMTAWSQLSPVYVLEPGCGDSPFACEAPAVGAYGVIVGGEKGFSSAEVGFLSSKGCRFVNLGPLILRATTATVTAAALFSLRRHVAAAPES